MGGAVPVTNLGDTGAAMRRFGRQRPARRRRGIDLRNRRLGVKPVAERIIWVRPASGSS